MPMFYNFHLSRGKETKLEMDPIASNELNMHQLIKPCYQGVVGWKAGKMTDRAQLLCLFEMEMIGPLFAATEVHLIIIQNAP